MSKTKAKLLDVSRMLFAKNGLDGTTMNDIAQASGKGRRTLYTYFKNKEDIYWAVIEGELERLSERMNQVALLDINPEDKLMELVYTHLNVIKETVQRNGNLRAEFFRNIIMVQKVRKNFDRNEQKLFMKIMAEGVEGGYFEIESIPLCSDILHYCIKGLEIPYIYGRLSHGNSPVISHAMVKRLLHKALGKSS